MKFKEQKVETTQIDMTPMIDMVFQLIVFFMLLINFDASEQHEQIQLPASVIARPPDKPPEFPILLHVTKEGNAIYGGQEVPIPAMGIYLRLERAELERQRAKEATVIIRAHRETLTGKVQELMKVCQDPKNGGFEQFVLRVKEEQE